MQISCVSDLTCHKSGVLSPVAYVVLLVRRFTSRTMLASTKDMDPAYTSQGTLLHDPTEFDMLLMQNYPNIPSLPLTTLLWVLSCGRFRLNWNIVAEADSDPAVGSKKHPPPVIKLTLCIVLTLHTGI